MKITELRIHVLKSPLAEPFAFSQGWVRQRSATLVEILTDAGIVGWGEAFAQGLEPPEIAATVIDKALRPLVTGADPLDTEVLWHRMYHMTRDYGRKGSVISAISAMDIALWDLSGYREMRQKLSMPIAGGENEHTLYGFRELLGAGAVDIAQPDLGSCGGISAARHIAALAQSHGVQVNPHVWGSAIAQAASLQLLAALPVAHHSIHAQEPVLEFDRSSHPFRGQLVTRPIRQANGWVEIPSGPGLGVEVDRSVLEKYRA
jgi:L-alanine-DL-glutamate epimerase-like enolase superfamily enzyme